MPDRGEGDHGTATCSGHVFHLRRRGIIRHIQCSGKFVWQETGDCTCEGKAKAAITGSGGEQDED